MGRFLALWAAASAVVGLLGRSPDLAAVAAPTVPLALLAGSGLTRLSWLLPHSGRATVWVTTLALLVPTLFLLLATNAGLQRGAAISAASIAIAGGGLAAVVLFASNWLDGRALGAACSFAVLIGLAALGLTLLHRLNFDDSARGAPLLLGQASRPELRLVEARVRDWWRQEPTTPIKVDPTLRPYLDWSLRDGPPIEWIVRPPERAERAVLGGAIAANRPPGDWRRLEVAERFVARSESLTPLSLWRWLVLRESLVRSEPYAILLPE
jgi:hypothetical protein